MCLFPVLNAGTCTTVSYIIIHISASRLWVSKKDMKRVPL